MILKHFWLENADSPSINARFVDINHHEKSESSNNIENIQKNISGDILRIFLLITCFVILVERV